MRETDRHIIQLLLQQQRINAELLQTLKLLQQQLIATDELDDDETVEEVEDEIPAKHTGKDLYGLFNGDIHNLAPAREIIKARGPINGRDLLRTLISRGAIGGGG